MNFYNKMERKLGKYAIKNLTLIIVICYAIGYAIRYIVPEFQLYLTLDVYRILHGQVWRIITWVLIPPYERNIFFALIMIVFYYSIGTVLEKTWGTFQYNLYIFSGLIFTIIGAFLSFLYSYIRFGGVSVSAISATLSFVVTTYYVNMSIFLAYACTFPDNMVLFMFIIPVKVKYLGFLYGGYIIYELVHGMMSLGTYGFIFPFVIGSSLLNFLVFLLQQESLLLKELWEPRHSAHIDLIQDMQKTTKRKIMGRLPCHVKIKQGINVLYAEEPRKTGIIWYSDIVQNVMVTLNIVRITFIHTFI